MTAPRLCAHCSEPLPPQSGRGRPALAHAGECRRLANNAKRLDGRVAEFLAATEPAPIGSGEDVRGAAPRRSVDASDLYNDDGTLDGFHVAEARPHLLKGKLFLIGMQAHEETRAFKANLRKYIKDVPEETRRLAALAPAIPYEEYMRMLRRSRTARPSPAFEYYVAHRDEIDAAQLALFGGLADAEDAAASTKRKRKAPAE